MHEEASWRRSGCFLVPYKCKRESVNGAPVDPVVGLRPPLSVFTPTVNRKKSTKKKKDIIFDVIQRKNGEENTTIYWNRSLEIKVIL